MSETLGARLRAEREGRRITLEQVASATRISLRHLQALEADQYVELPAAPFVRGFVSAYARFVGLDAREVLTEWGPFVAERSRERPSREAGHSGYVFERKEGDQSRTVLAVILGAFAVIGLVVLIVLKPKFGRHKMSAADRLRAAHEVASGTPEATAAALPVVPAAPAAPLPIVAPAPVSTPAAPVAVLPVVPPVPVAAPVPPVVVAVAPVSTPAPVPTPTPSGSPALPSAEKDPLLSGRSIPLSEVKEKVVVRASADIWVRYQVDEWPNRRIILRQGNLLVLKARRMIRVQTSHPEQTTVARNGAGAEPLARARGRVVLKQDVTYFAPHQAAESVQDPFPGQGKLQGANVPESPKKREASEVTPELSTGN